MDRLEQYSNMIDGWLWETDSLHRVVYISDGVKSYAGLDANCYYGKHLLNQVEYNVSNLDWEKYSEALNAHKPFYDIKYCQIEPLNTNWVTVSGEPFFGESGEFQGYRGVAKNISNLVSLSNEKRRLKSQLVNAVDIMDEGFVFYDSDDRLVHCNEKYREYYPKSKHLIIQGASFEGIIRGGVSLGEYKDAIGSEEEWIAERMAAHHSGHTDIEQKLSDGRWLRIRERKTPDGGTVGMRVDITNLKNREQELEESSQRYSATVNTALDCIILMDQYGKITEFNPSAETTFGFKREEALGQDMAELIIPSRYRTAHREGLQRFLSTSECNAIGQHVELEAIKKDGTEFPIDLSISVSHEAEGPIFIGFIRDTTTRRDIAETLKIAQSDAESANLAKTNFLSTMSHEIRTPLNGVLGLTQLLAKTNLDHDQHQKVEIILSSGNDLLNIVNSILDMSKIEAGSIELEETIFCLDDLVSTTISSFQSLAEDKNLTLRTENQLHPSIYLRGDTTRIRQVLSNLLSNAIKFTDKGDITLTIGKAAALDGFVQNTSTPLFHFSVQDSGEGIAPDRIDNIFDPFTQEDSSITRRFGGTGLGLAIVKQLTELMGGKIQAHSELRKGTKFDIYLPLAKATEEETTNLAKKNEDDYLQPAENLNILVVEDNIINATIVRSFLEQFGHHVRHVEDGKKAVDAAAENWADFVFMDIHMPEMDGVEATRIIRSTKIGETLPIVGLTAEAFVDRHQNFMESGMDGVLTKPFTEQKLADTIEQYR